MFSDLQYGFRQLRLNPGFAAIAVITLALGIGANTALFSVVRAVLLKPLPYPHPERIVRVWMDNRRLQNREDWASYLNYVDYKRLGTSFESMAAFRNPAVNLNGDGSEPERIRGVIAEAAIFDVLGVKPVEGRVFRKDEEVAGQDKVVVIGWGLWQRRFGGQPALDKVLDFDGLRLTVIGVMPRGFAFPDKTSEFLTPLVVNENAKRRGGYWLQMVARLRPGVTPAQAQSEMDVVGRQLEQQYPNFNAGYGVYVNPLERHVAGNVRTPLLVLLAAVGFVLLIACVNVAGLVLARAESRGREVVVRAAIGASRGQLIRQLVMEAAALASIAGITGIAVAYAGVRALLWTAPPDFPRLDEIGLDVPVLGCAVLLTTATALAFGLWPAWRSSQVDVQHALRDSGRGVSGTRAAARTRSVLLVVQCALAIMLLAGASLLLRSLGALRSTTIGFRTADVLTMRINASQTRYASAAQLRQFYGDVLQRVRALPRVTNVALITDLFLSATPNSGTFTLEDRPPFPPAEEIEATTDAVSPGFFEMMQARLVRGRFVDARDAGDAPRAIVVNETFAHRYWPNQDPIGKRMVFGRPRPGDQWITIVGVVGDMRRRGLHQDARLETFGPTGQSIGRNMQLLVTADREALALAPSALSEIRSIDATSPVTAVRTVESDIGESLAVRRFQARLLALFSALAVLLAAVGIFGLMAQVVVRRTHEIGVRMALGATRRKVLAMVVRQGVSLAAAGTLVGIVGALAIARTLESLLFGIGAADPVSYVASAAVMAVSVLLACGLPAWRAAHVDPMVALRDDG
jgi:putative ABC transport system permease protein